MKWKHSTFFVNNVWKCELGTPEGRQFGNQRSVRKQWCMGMGTSCIDVVINALLFSDSDCIRPYWSTQRDLLIAELRSLIVFSTGTKTFQVWAHNISSLSGPCQIRLRSLSLISLTTIQRYPQSTAGLPWPITIITNNQNYIMFGVIFISKTLALHWW